jgi:glycine reductase
MISALGPVAADLGANRVVRGIKIPHPCGDPSLDLAGDHDLRVRLVRGSLKAIATSLDQAALFDGVSA